MRGFLLVAAFAWLVAGCSNPIEQVRVVDSRPSIVIEGAPGDSLVVVDGLSMGPANDFVEKALMLEPGTHFVEIMSDGLVVFSEKIFVSGAGTKTIKVPPENE